MRQQTKMKNEFSHLFLLRSLNLTTLNMMVTVLLSLL